ncbi:MAG: hypothetical protein ABIG10_02235 [bacterium]
MWQETIFKIVFFLAVIVFIITAIGFFLLALKIILLFNDEIHFIGLTIS